VVLEGAGGDVGTREAQLTYNVNNAATDGVTILKGRHTCVQRRGRDKGWQPFARERE
jgi:hypothetical protein